jgi:hypothetical protein
MFELLERDTCGEHVGILRQQGLKDALECLDRLPLTVDYFGEATTPLPIEIDLRDAHIGGHRGRRERGSKRFDRNLSGDELPYELFELGGVHRINSSRPRPVCETDRPGTSTNRPID